MGVSDLISLCSAVVAMLAAVYARWQAMGARKANEISLHENRFKVYSALARYRVHLTGQGTNVREEEVWRIADAAELSDFYFPPEIPSRMQRIFERSLELLSLNDEWKDAKEANDEKAKELVKPRHELMRQIRDDCLSIGNDMKTYLRIGNS